jgi:hypothetical protein
MLMKVPSARTRRGERGELSWVGLVLLLGLLAGAYLAWVWVPVYVRKQQIEEVVRTSQNAAVKSFDDAALVEDMARRIRALETVEVEGAGGRAERVPLVDLRPEHVTWARNPETRTLRVAFSYSVDVVYPWIGRTQPYTTDVDLTADVAIPDWGRK